MIKHKVFVLLREFETNTYLAWDDTSRQAMLIDPAQAAVEVLDYIRQNDLKVKCIVNTHGHADHIGGNVFFREKLSVPVCIHADDAPLLTDGKLNLSAFLECDLTLPAADRLLQDNDTLELGQVPVRVIHTPGHTQGCICLLAEDLLFSGDTLFYHDIGRTDLPGGNYEQILESIRAKLLILTPETLVLPGHGPNSTILDEKENNPYL